ncbi:1-deoxy-D-xylulose-5-phosphate reductoisomerase [Pseudoxanthomonas broegbernensis]|uniref:1-deoxy-D-xylulose 5-phosphate reductoisomerase n=1 Tax=Pseudoxanthomonas broegbernensis TaxID=83619 RepID=A0A7V8GM62_9GAMM|nr:1-deoxy-D-xylulose-5-phosphate reductoisomerase [Pseudoxanthomonas broegbernensis]KAF1686291.1 1-deoxy-D-xylulose-5-phosphate reductoisomerase [Pseudoxanthomonas broegbernensis]MBB6063975.1 1-deoxy-D-xylulose-5-phosphate reductoisomerase [Pseudoxanthomonas broegbernensis]
MQPTADMRQVAVLGATGSIGASALDVIARHRGRLRASVLAAGSNAEALVKLCITHRPDHAAVADPAAWPRLRDGLRDAGLPTHAHAGPDALQALAAGPECDTVVAAIVGAAGLGSTLAAARAGKRLLLANKESLVLAGELVMAATRRSGAQVVPIDSEHSAVFQCLQACRAGDVRRIVLTASGGPFRGWDRARLARVTPAQAVAHPKWSMGPKISVDSATLMNKGLEVIEAHHLFGLPPARIGVLVHPQSLVHALVEYVDGSTLAQLGLPDMRTALAVGLGWPERIDSGVTGLDLLAQGRLEFEAPDLDAFPCLRLAGEALAAGGTAPAVLNAANEEAVSAFLQGRIGFLAIPELVEDALAALPAAPADSLEALLAADADARRRTRHRIDSSPPGSPAA